MFSRFTCGVLFVLVSINSLSALPPCVCGRNILPVCGSDGVTYDNQCTFDCAKLTKPELNLADQGQCKPLLDTCICTYEYKPVCGSDGKTYANECSFSCEQTKQKDLTINHRGKCEELCICGLNYKPVCGSDSKTYPNECSLNCEKKKRSDLKVVSEGACPSDTQADSPDCICPMDYSPVCGSDGETYPNECSLNCEQRVKTELTLKQTGECSFSKCLCTRELKPVCGTDAITYANKCLLNCAATKKAGLTIKQKGPCEEVKGVEQADNLEDDCECERNLKLVCGTDGMTYSNPCELNCAAMKTVAQLHVSHDGACGKVKVVEDSQS